MLSRIAQTPLLHRKDMYAALGILRRESLPYYVFEVDEVYSEEERAERFRVIASKDLIRRGYGKFFLYYKLMEVLKDQPFFIPENLLAYKDGMFDEPAQELISFLEKQKCTLQHYTDFEGKEVPCKYTGKRLKDFSFISRDDQFDLDYLQGKLGRRKPDLKQAEELERNLHKYNAAQRLVYDLQRESRLGFFGPMDIMKAFFRDAEEMGLVLSEKETKQVIAMIFDLHNHTHQWCIRGWMPSELSHAMPRRGMPALSFEPGMQKAFSDGSIDKEELIRELTKKGITVE